MNITIDNGSLSWTPKIVLFNGKLYSAPLNILPYLVRQTLVEYLKQKK